MIHASAVSYHDTSRNKEIDEYIGTITYITFSGHIILQKLQKFLTVTGTETACGEKDALTQRIERSEVRVRADILQTGVASAVSSWCFLAAPDCSSTLFDSCRPVVDNSNVRFLFSPFACLFFSLSISIFVFISISISLWQTTTYKVRYLNKLSRDLQILLILIRARRNKE